MELKSATIKEIEEMQGKNALVIISNGQMKVAELPSFGIVEITNHDEKVTFVEEKRKKILILSDWTTRGYLINV